MLLWALLLVAAAGLLIRWLVPRYEPEWSINRTEFILGLLAMLFAFWLIIQPVGTNMARSNSLVFNEYYNGYEVAAHHERIPCDRDGPCVHEYDCDPYVVMVTKTRQVPSGTDSKGNTTYRTETYTEPETRYHRCPYVNEEWTFRIDTMFGTFTIAEHIFPDNPDRHRFRPGKGVPGNVASGVPPFWRAADERLRGGDPGPVTVVRHYDNYILASQRTILKKYSNAIDRYLAAGLLPQPARGTSDFYYTDKAYFVGLRPDNYPAWRFGVMKLNAALGADLQGDLHFVVVNASRVRSADEYFGALQAYWQSPALGRNAASKNTIVVVVGTEDGRTIQWARAATGMPLGNEAMLVDLQNSLKGAPLDPAALFGQPKASLQKDGDDHEARIQHTDGVLEKVLWGEHKFDRVCMTCKDDKGKTGFSYLKDQIPLKTGQKTLIYLVTFFASLILWAIMCAVNLHIPEVVNLKVPRYRRERHGK